MFSSMKLFIKQIVSKFSFLAMNMTLAVEMALNIHNSLTLVMPASVFRSVVPLKSSF